MTKEKSIKKISLMSAIFLIIGSLAGSSIIAMPQQLAFTGSITLISFILVTLGALCLALIYAKAGEIFDRPSPIALANYVNPILGAKSGFFYVFSNLISNVSVLVAGLGYLALFFPVLNHPTALGIVIIALIWLFTAMSLRGAGVVTRIVSISVSALLFATIVTAVFGWFDFSGTQFVQNWNVSGEPATKAIMSGFVILLFSFVGVEVVAVNYSHIDNPKRNVPLATIIGFLIVATVYIASTTVMEGMFAAKELQANSAPFSMAIDHMFGAKSLGYIVSLVMSVACLASFLVWNLSTVSAAKTSAEDGYLPKFFTHTNKYGINHKGLVINAIIMTAIEVILMLLGSGIAKAFNITVTVSVLLVMFPYFWSGIALLKKNIEDKRKSIKDTVIVCVSSLFILSAFISATLAELWLVIAFVIVTLSVYILLDAKRKAEKKVSKKLKGGKK